MNDLERNYFNELLRKYNGGVASAEEIKFLESFYEMFEVNDELITADNEAAYADLKRTLKASVNQQINVSAPPSAKTIKIKRLTARYAAAASILVFVMAGIYFVAHYHMHKQEQLASEKIVPGGSKATLKLADGRIIDLSDAQNGQLAQQANISIHKNAEGLLVYTASGNQASRNANGTIQQNTISTPNGGQYQVVLPDGTSVMLNAASSLTYPVAFEGAERQVQLKGEAYFEVAHNKQMPFKVKCAGQTVTVLGTHFNINAYYDESAVKTTLLQGAVMVSAGNTQVTIKPGEQALYADKASNLLKRGVDVEKEVAWKNGVFAFDGDDIQTVMRQVARWYDVAVVFNGNFSDAHFYGEISRSSSLDDVIKILELSNVKFDIQGRKIIVNEAR